jgi:hypothetical protein
LSSLTRNAVIQSEGTLDFSISTAFFVCDGKQVDQIWPNFLLLICAHVKFVCQTVRIRVGDELPDPDQTDPDPDKKIAL